MDSSIYDPLRKSWVKDLPEEQIRQKWLDVMVNHLGFPKELIVVEKAIHLLPHLSNQECPTHLRRVDILVYTKLDEKSHLHPLLLIECKGIALTEKALLQVKGYNHFIQASFFAIANEKEIQLAFDDQQEVQILDFLPAYTLLQKAIR